MQVVVVIVVIAIVAIAVGVGCPMILGFKGNFPPRAQHTVFKSEKFPKTQLTA